MMQYAYDGDQNFPPFGNGLVDLNFDSPVLN